jgi:hypothetical protein
MNTRTTLVGSASTCALAIAAIVAGCGSSTAHDHPAGKPVRGVVAGGRRTSPGRRADGPGADRHPWWRPMAEPGHHAEERCQGRRAQAAADLRRALPCRDKRLRHVRLRPGRWQCPRCYRGEEARQCADGSREGAPGRMRVMALPLTWAHPEVSEFRT